MEVKEPTARSIGGTTVPQDVSKRDGTPANSTISLETGSAVEIEIQPEASLKDPKVQALNRAINIVNVVADASNQISDLVDGIEGIAAQIKKGVDPQHQDALKNEAQGLVEAIKKTAQIETEGSQPLYGDPIRVELEQELGKTLELIFPDVAKDTLGFANAVISKKDFIINTQAGLAQARQRLEELRKSVHETAQKVRDTVDAYEVARQNGEASRANIRDVDQALKIAFDARSSIGTDPKTALGSVGKLSGNAIQLLE